MLTKSKTLKLAPLLAQYLYDQKNLSLAGIGTFSLDTSARINTDTQHLSEGISFKTHNAAQEDIALIAYLSKETGKMKTLAASDLRSYTELAREFLNIGKPFQIEGVGTLVKNKGGDFSFTPDHILIDKGKELGIKELSVTSISDDSLTTYESLRPRSERSPISKKVFLSFLAIATIGLIVWFSYRTYKNGGGKGTGSHPDPDETVLVADTTQYVSPASSNSGKLAGTATNADPVVTLNGKYRFVIELASRKRALYRYNLLKKGNVPIQISTNDSITYKLFFVLPAAAIDTTRILDSLSIWYPAANRKKAFVDR